MIKLHNTVFARVDQADWLLPTLARLVFAATLLMYFWISGLTKLGDGFAGILFLSDSAYIQMFPKAVEALGYDTSQLSIWHRVIALIGTWAEFILPLFIVLGILTRLAALGMIGFIAVQSVVDILGHDLAGKDIGTWFDQASGALILDQRAFWVLLLLILVIKGAGPLSFDRALTPMKQV
jgi:putative oxidoreductase